MRFPDIAYDSVLVSATGYSGAVRLKKAYLYGKKKKPRGAPVYYYNVTANEMRGVISEIKSRLYPGTYNTMSRAFKIGKNERKKTKKKKKKKKEKIVVSPTTKKKILPPPTTHITIYIYIHLYIYCPELLIRV